ncbi:hypothetical protein HK097_011097 [Rhizophlyctis rosea]|uniref:Uncharacterized protein n=1 Tax=Rhizophlyctis rosea TaxID=64517 RepID=A0AAD5S6T3_9FUNG|nr:hypothetical protein HK097_011097 [Rhizophlyctis rosea]
MERLRRTTSPTSRLLTVSFTFLYSLLNLHSVSAQSTISTTTVSTTSPTSTSTTSAEISPGVRLTEILIPLVAVASAVFIIVIVLFVVYKWYKQSRREITSIAGSAKVVRLDVRDYQRGAGKCEDGGEGGEGVLDRTGMENRRSEGVASPRLGPQRGAMEMGRPSSQMSQAAMYNNSIASPDRHSRSSSYPVNPNRLTTSTVGSHSTARNEEDFVQPGAYPYPYFYPYKELTAPPGINSPVNAPTEKPLKPALRLSRSANSLSVNDKIPSPPPGPVPPLPVSATSWSEQSRQSRMSRVSTRTNTTLYGSQRSSAGAESTRGLLRNTDQYNSMYSGMSSRGTSIVGGFDPHHMHMRSSSSDNIVGMNRLTYQQPPLPQQPPQQHQQPHSSHLQPPNFTLPPSTLPNPSPSDATLMSAVEEWVSIRSRSQASHNTKPSLERSDPANQSTQSEADTSSTSVLEIDDRIGAGYDNSLEDSSPLDVKVSSAIYAVAPPRPCPTPTPTPMPAAAQAIARTSRSTHRSVGSVSSLGSRRSESEGVPGSVVREWSHDVDAPPLPVGAVSVSNGSGKS